jgi:hypothetical protein
MLVGFAPQDPAHRRALRLRKGARRTGHRGLGRGGQAAQTDAQAEEAVAVVERGGRGPPRPLLEGILAQVRPRTHDTLHEANYGLDYSPVQTSPASRPVDLAGLGRLRPAQAGAHLGHRRKAAVGATATAPAADPDPRLVGFRDTPGGCGPPAEPPKPCGRSPGRPKGSRSGPAKRHPALKTAS